MRYIWIQCFLFIDSIYIKKVPDDSIECLSGIGVLHPSLVTNMIYVKPLATPAATSVKWKSGKVDLKFFDLHFVENELRSSHELDAIAQLETPKILFDEFASLLNKESKCLMEITGYHLLLLIIRNV